MCDIVDVEDTEPINPFTFGDAPKSDHCDVNIECIIDEVISYSHDYSRWFEGVDPISYTLNVKFTSMSQSDLINSFAIQWEVYLLLYSGIGIFSIFIYAIMLFYHYIFNRYKNPRIKLAFIPFLAPIYTSLLQGIVIAFFPIGIIIILNAILMTGTFMDIKIFDGCENEDFPKCTFFMTQQQILNKVDEISILRGRTGLSQLIIGFVILKFTAEIFFRKNQKEVQLEEFHHGNTYNQTKWRIQHFYYHNILICLLMVFGKYLWYILVVLKVGTMIYESILDKMILEDALYRCGISMLVGIIINLSTLGATDFFDFLLSYFIELALQICERIYAVHIEEFLEIYLEEKYEVFEKFIKVYFQMKGFDESDDEIDSYDDESEQENEQKKQQNQQELSIKIDQNVKIKDKCILEKQKVNNKYKKFKPQQNQQKAEKKQIQKSYESNNNDNELNTNEISISSMEKSQNQSFKKELSQKQQIHSVEQLQKNNHQQNLNESKGSQILVTDEYEKSEISEIQENVEFSNKQGQNDSEKWNQMIEKRQNYKNKNQRQYLKCFELEQNQQSDINSSISDFDFTLSINKKDTVKYMLEKNYIDLIEEKFNERKQKWKADQIEEDIKLSDDWHGLYIWAFSSQYYFIATLLLFGLFLIVFGFQTIIQQNYNLFQDPGCILYIIFWIINCHIIYYLCVYLGQKINLWETKKQQKTRLKQKKKLQQQKQEEQQIKLTQKKIKKQEKVIKKEEVKQKKLQAQILKQQVEIQKKLLKQQQDEENKKKSENTQKYKSQYISNFLQNESYSRNLNQTNNQNLIETPQNTSKIQTNLQNKSFYEYPLDSERINLKQNLTIKSSVHNKNNLNEPDFSFNNDIEENNQVVSLQQVNQNKQEQFDNFKFPPLNCDRKKKKQADQKTLGEIKRQMGYNFGFSSQKIKIYLNQHLIGIK
ncbi:hypothetical protein PPERSA_01940 [Pseudocohnilembus persalinus]|uniref:Transmembrane protein n=1 Tax=Pseudocohnilembus persalinus TaxID=266149 RepID=A0A0V0R3J0_PSEPJ|nr:hypothetical protein PPERSA_01940 [Pseudocohnilembus persalinus]|eukprot:KRX09053.1 hypothetical protein PPERSA_01940 [Pseudocohnilembus persalinus]